MSQNQALKERMLERSRQLKAKKEQKPNDEGQENGESVSPVKQKEENSVPAPSKEIDTSKQNGGNAAPQATTAPPSSPLVNGKQEHKIDSESAQQLQRLQKDVEEQAQKVKSLTLENQSLRQKLEQHAQLVASEAKLQTEHKCLLADIERLNLLVTEKDQESVKMKNSLLGHIKDRDAQIEALTTKQKQFETQQEAAKHFKALVQQRDEKIEELFREANERDEQIKELNSKLKQSSQYSPSSTANLSAPSSPNSRILVNNDYVIKLEQKVTQLQNDLQAAQEAEKKKQRQLEQITEVAQKNDAEANELVHQLEEKLSVLEDANKRLAKEIEAKNQLQAEEASKQGDQQSELQKLREELQRKEGERNELQQKLSQADKAAAENQSKFQALQQITSTLRQSENSQSDRLSQAQLQLQQVTEERNRLVQQLTLANNLKSNVEAQMQQLQRDTEKLRTEKDQLAKTVQSLQSVRTEVDERVLSQSSQLERHQQKGQELQTLLQAKDLEIQRVHTEFAKKDQLIQELTNEVQLSQNQIDTIHKRAEKAEAQLQEHIQALREQQQIQKVQLDQLAKEKEQAVQDLHQATQKLLATQSQIQQLDTIQTQERQRYENEIASLTQQVSHYQQLAASQQQSDSPANGQMVLAEIEAKYQAQIKELTGRIEEERSTVQQLKVQVQQLMLDFKSRQQKSNETIQQLLDNEKAKADYIYILTQEKEDLERKLAAFTGANTGGGGAPAPEQPASFSVSVVPVTAITANSPSRAPDDSSSYIWSIWSWIRSNVIGYVETPETKYL